MQTAIANQPGKKRQCCVAERGDEHDQNEQSCRHAPRPVPLLEDAQQMMSEDGPVAHPAWIQRPLPRFVHLFEHMAGRGWLSRLGSAHVFIALT